MKKLLLVILFLVCGKLAIAQNTDTSSITKNDSSKFIPVDVEPTYPGGMINFMNYIIKNEKNSGDSGKVYVTFVVEKDGSLINATITKSLSVNADKEALRLINNCPKWIPGSAGGKPCRVRFTLPILFSTE